MGPTRRITGESVNRKSGAVEPYDFIVTRLPSSDPFGDAIEATLGRDFGSSVPEMGEPIEAEVEFYATTRDGRGRMRVTLVRLLDDSTPARAV